MKTHTLYIDFFSSLSTKSYFDQFKRTESIIYWHGRCESPHLNHNHISCIQHTQCVSVSLTCYLEISSRSKIYSITFDSGQIDKSSLKMASAWVSLVVTEKKKEVCLWSVQIRIYVYYRWRYEHSKSRWKLNLEICELYHWQIV